MRIIAGEFKGTSIYGSKDRKIRPLKDMVRESIFNFLAHSNKISFQMQRANVLDLYSGTGSFGLECISRGAAESIFIEKEKEAVKILEKNIQKLKIKDETKIFSDDVFNVIKKYDKFFFDQLSDMKLDLIFCDPPFKDTKINDLIKLIISKNILKKNGIIILHRHKNTEERLTIDFKIVDKRVYGLSKIIFGKLFS
jgi:16S rRNA (guanine966-N2)-methyltransferase